MDLSQFSVGELAKLKAQIDEEIVMRAKRTREALRQRFAEMATSAGYSITEVLTAQAPQRQRALPKTVWRDRRNGKVWVGRGRMPDGFSKTHAVQIDAHLVAVQNVP